MPFYDVPEGLDTEPEDPAQLRARVMARVNRMREITIFVLLLLVLESSMIGYFQIQNSEKLTTLAQQNHELAKQNEQVTQTLAECTTPGPNPAPNTGHPCFDRSQQATGKAVSTIDLAIIYSAECALADTQHPDTVSQCVTQKLLQANQATP